MLTVIVILCALIWLPILFHQITHRGLVVLLVWLFVAPVATNLVHGKTNPFFESSTATWERGRTASVEVLSKNPQDITVFEVVNRPTRLVFCLFIFVLLVDVLLKRKRVMSLDRTEICMVIFCLILLANIFMQSERLPWSLRQATDGYAIPFFAYYVARRLVISEDGFFHLTRVLGYLGFYLIIIGLVERVAYPGLVYRLRGPFGSENSYYYVLMVTFFAVLLSTICSRAIPEEKQALHPCVRWFVLCLAPVIILLTWTRGNWVGFLMGAWVFLFLGYRLIRGSRKMGLVGIVLLLVPVMVLAVKALVADEYIAGRILSAGTVEFRLARWQVAMQEGAQHPIFGVGFQNLQMLLGRKLGGRFASAAHAHNLFVSTFAELGLVGLLAYLAILASVIGTGLTLYRRGRNSQDRWRGVAIIAVMVAFMIPGIFNMGGDSMSVYAYFLVGGIAGLYSLRGPVPVSDYRVRDQIAPIPLRQEARRGSRSPSDMSGVNIGSLPG